MTPGTAEVGRHALFSASERRPYTCTVECSACREEARVSYLELGALLFPVHFHLPPFVTHYNSWMRCPSCGRRAWVRIHPQR